MLATFVGLSSITLCATWLLLDFPHKATTFYVSNTSPQPHAQRWVPKSRPSHASFLSPEILQAERLGSHLIVPPEPPTQLPKPTSPRPTLPALLAMLGASSAAMLGMAVAWALPRPKSVYWHMTSTGEPKTRTVDVQNSLECVFTSFPPEIQEQKEPVAADPYPHPTKFVVVVGGVCSSLGKGVTCSSLGAVLKAEGYRVTAIKIDPYVNTDAGLMSPFEHGEVFVLDDGGEVDLDLGNYERTMGLHLTRQNNITTGTVYSAVIDKERKGKYLGKTVQIIPHVTGEVVEQLLRVGQVPTDGSGARPQLCLIELGGTVGDIESMLFLEALRILKYNLDPENFCLLQCSLIPLMSGTQKTKPTQHTVKELQAVGLQPDIIVGRCEEPLKDDTRRKISEMCGVPAQAVLSVHNVPNLYDVPQMLFDGGVVNLLTAVLRLDRLQRTPPAPASGGASHAVTLADWATLARRKTTQTEPVTIAIVAKYTEKDTKGKAYTGDTYLSVLKALDHSAIAVGRKLNVVWVDSAELEAPEGSESFETAVAKLQQADGILVPGGFGDRGIAGKMFAANWARHKRKPFLGICLGMQMAVVGFCRDVLKIEDATSEEFDPDGQGEHVLQFMPEVSTQYMGGTMVLGARTIRLQPRSLASRLYGGAEEVEERQRHRYEVAESRIAEMEVAGLTFSGKDPSGRRMEVVELPVDTHPFFLGLQCHPEFKSRPGYPSPPFLGFLHASAGTLEAGLEACASQGLHPHYRPAKPRTRRR